ncbi:hypothetical protein F5984_19565 [Rudanella paleaurantiibacter]|uniref:DUF4345 domain-containing protein n=1 Tax=Rudanella paleaurantiibacter TaxID=2614655 RepID=A0A7J5TV58_9BACT|nr:hypothetical protein [Rudanella paleaurantiibacter]KAB7727957.1 hypothetical protein F5984_19565 [Rudanella paleaurantiibacter]
MSRSLVLLILGLYGLLLSGVMLFATTWLLKSYGIDPYDVSHISLMRYLGLSNFGLALLALLNRNLSNSASLQTVLLVSAIVVLGGIGVGTVDSLLKDAPLTGFFLADTFLRLVMGLALLYCYNRERQQVISQVAA